MHQLPMSRILCIQMHKFSCLCSFYIMLSQSMLVLSESVLYQLKMMNTCNIISKQQKYGWSQEPRPKFNSNIQHITSNSVLSLLMQIPDAAGTLCYLKVLQIALYIKN